jgi:hypothetical protein
MMTDKQQIINTIPYHLRLHTRRNNKNISLEKEESLLLQSSSSLPQLTKKHQSSSSKTIIRNFYNNHQSYDKNIRPFIRYKKNNNNNMNNNMNNHRRLTSKLYRDLPNKSDRKIRLHRKCKKLYTTNDDNNNNNNETMIINNEEDTHITNSTIPTIEVNENNIDSTRILNNDDNTITTTITTSDKNNTINNNNHNNNNNNNHTSTTTNNTTITSNTLDRKSYFNSKQKSSQKNYYLNKVISKDKSDRLLNSSKIDPTKKSRLKNELFPLSVSVAIDSNLIYYVCNLCNNVCKHYKDLTNHCNNKLLQERCKNTEVCSLLREFIQMFKLNLNCFEQTEYFEYIKKKIAIKCMKLKDTTSTTSTNTTTMNDSHISTYPYGNNHHHHHY